MLMCKSNRCRLFSCALTCPANSTRSFCSPWPKIQPTVSSPPMRSALRCRILRRLPPARGLRHSPHQTRSQAPQFCVNRPRPLPKTLKSSHPLQPRTRPIADSSSRLALPLCCWCLWQQGSTIPPEIKRRLEAAAVGGNPQLLNLRRRWRQPLSRRRLRRLRQPPRLPRLKISATRQPQTHRHPRFSRKFRLRLLQPPPIKCQVWAYLLKNTKRVTVCRARKQFPPTPNRAITPSLSSLPFRETFLAMMLPRLPLTSSS